MSAWKDALLTLLGCRWSTVKLRPSHSSLTPSLLTTCFQIFCSSSSQDPERSGSKARSSKQTQNTSTTESTRAGILEIKQQHLIWLLLTILIYRRPAASYGGSVFTHTPTRCAHSMNYFIRLLQYQCKVNDS